MLMASVTPVTKTEAAMMLILRARSAYTVLALGCLFALPACHDEASTHPHSRDTAVHGTIDGRILVRLTLPPDDVGDLRSTARRMAVLEEAHVLLTGYDKDGQPVNAPVSEATWDGVTWRVAFSVKAGHYRLEVSHPSGAFASFAPQEPIELAIAETRVIAHRFERLTLTVRGALRAGAEVPPATSEVELRWAADPDDADCQRGGVLGVPALADDGTFSFQTPMPVGEHLCAVARADDRRRVARPHTFSRPREVVVDLGVLELSVEDFGLRTFGAELRRDPDRLIEGAGSATVDARLILLEVQLDTTPGALAFPDEDGDVPSDRTRVVELSIVDTAQLGDQDGQPIRHSLTTLPVGVLPHLGAVSPTACAGRHDAASQTLYAALTGEVQTPLTRAVGVSTDRLLLPYCLISTGTGRKTIEVTLTAGGRRYRKSHAIDLDQTPTEGVLVRLQEGKPHRGRVYVDAAFPTWHIDVDVPLGSGSWYVHISRQPLETPECVLSDDLAWSELTPGPTPEQGFPHPVGPPREVEGCGDAVYDIQEEILCVHVLDTAGNVSTQALHVARVNGKSGADVGPGTRPSGPGSRPPDGGDELPAAPSDLPRCGQPPLPDPGEERLWTGAECPFEAIDTGACLDVSPTRLTDDLVFRVAAWDGLEHFRSLEVEIDGAVVATRQPTERLLVLPLGETPEGPFEVRFIGRDLLDRPVPLRVVDAEGRLLDGWDGEGVRFFRDTRPPAVVAAGFDYCPRNQNDVAAACDGRVDIGFAVDGQAAEVLAPHDANVPLRLVFDDIGAGDTEHQVCALVSLGSERRELDEVDAIPMQVEPGGMLIPPLDEASDHLVSQRVSMRLIDRACLEDEGPEPLTIQRDGRAPYIRRNADGRPRTKIWCHPPLISECIGEATSSSWLQRGDAPARRYCEDITNSEQRILGLLNAPLTDAGNALLDAGIRYKVIATDSDIEPSLDGPICVSDIVQGWASGRSAACPDADPGPNLEPEECHCAPPSRVTDLLSNSIEVRVGDDDPLHITLLEDLCSSDAALSPPMRLWLAVEDAVGHSDVLPLYDEGCTEDGCRELRFRLLNGQGFGERGGDIFYRQHHVCPVVDGEMPPYETSDTPGPDDICNAL